MQNVAVYVITNTITGEQYVGASQHVTYRLHEHKRAMRGGYHPNPRLQSAWKQYGEIAFDFTIIEYVQAENPPRCTAAERSELDRLERSWIDKLHPAYNRIRA